jgi:hypothetical protein
MCFPTFFSDMYKQYHLSYEFFDLLSNFLKGQLISKGLFSILNSSKNRTKKFDSTTMISKVDMFSFVFLEEFEDTKKDISKLTDL